MTAIASGADDHLQENALSEEEGTFVDAQEEEQNGSQPSLDVDDVSIGGDDIKDSHFAQTDEESPCTSSASNCSESNEHPPPPPPPLTAPDTEPKEKPKRLRDQYSHHHEYIFVIGAGLALAFNSGFINGCCLSGLLVSQTLVAAGHTAKQSVAGFTGAYTNAGLALADNDVDIFGFQVKMVLCFMMGSCISGVLNPRSIPYEIGPTFGPTFVIGSVLLAIASFLAAVEEETRADTRYIFYFAAAANGLQNGMTSMYSANLIRTCHFTGTSTDIGLFVGQLLRGNSKNLWKLRVLVALAVAFWFGSFVSFHAVQRFRGWTLLINAILFFIIGCSLIAFLVKNLGISVWQATSGTWEWEETLKKLQLYTKDGTPVSEEKLMSTFDRIDQDGNEFIETHELRDALRESGVRVSSRKLSRMFSLADVDNDGLISRDEWRVLVRGASSRKFGDSSCKQQESTNEPDDDNPGSIRHRSILEANGGGPPDTPRAIRERSISSMGRHSFT